MEIFDLFVSALMPILKVLLLTAIGSLLASDAVDILGVDARKHLNNVVFFVFNPALVATNLAKYVTLGSMAMLWYMPLNILITFIIGSAFGWLVIRITNAPRDLWGLVLGCCASGNLGNMPLIIIPAICRERGSPFGDVAVCHGNGLAYASLSMAIGAIYMWSYVYNIVRIYSSNDSQGDDKQDVFSKGSSESVSKCSSPSLLPLKDNEDSEDHFKLSCSMSNETEEVSMLEVIKKQLQPLGKRLNLRRFFSPSTTGVIVGFTVGMVPVFRKAVIGDSAPFRVVQDSAYLLGEAAIPTVTLVVGANLLKGLQGSEVRLSIILGITLVRYVVLPIFGVVTVKSAIHFGLIQSDPLYQFVLLLQFALPPAMNIGTMTQLFGAGESACSVILLSTYALAAISLTLWSTFFMWLVRLGQLAAVAQAMRTLYEFLMGFVLFSSIVLSSLIKPNYHCSFEDAHK